MAAREAAMSGAAAVRAGLYNAFMRRTSVYVTVCVAASYATTEAYFGATERIWASINKGVRAAARSSLRAGSAVLGLCGGRMRGTDFFFVLFCWVHCVRTRAQKTWPEVQANLPEKTDDDDDDY